MKKHLRTLFLGLVLIAGLSLAPAASAASIKMEVKVPGLTSWVLVKVGSWPQYGGRVVWDNSLGCYVTDDVARGETMRITISPSAGEIPQAGANYGVWCSSQHRYLIVRSVALPYVDPGYGVPTDPALDNLHVDMYSNFGLFSKRIPIGPRVR